MNKLSLIIFMVCWSFFGLSQPASWTVTPTTYNYSMTLTGRIELDCSDLNSSSNYLAAFIGGQCRGVVATNVQVNGANLGFLQIYSNSAGSQPVELRFYDHSTGLVHSSIDSVTFLSNATVGSLISPFILTTNHKPVSIGLTNNTVLESATVGAFIGTVSATDIDAWQTLTLSLTVGDLDNGSFLISNDSLLLNTVLDYAVQNTFQIKVEVNDGQSCALVDTFQINVTDIAFAPVALNDTVQGTEDVLLPILVLLNDSDYDNDLDASSVTVLQMPVHGTYSVLANGTINYMADTNYFGVDTLSYMVCDMTSPNVLCDTAFVYITIVGVDEAPIAINDTLFTIEDIVLNFNATSNDFDVDGNFNPSSITITTPTTHGIISFGSAGAMTYTPDSFFNGLDSMVYNVCDLTSPTPMCATAVTYITTIPVPNPPIANNDTLIGTEDILLPISVLLNDTDGDNDIDSSSVMVYQAPVHGSYTILANGTINYIADTNYFGTDSLVYTVCDLTLAGALCDTAKVYITMLPVDDAPVALNDTISTLEDVVLNYDVTANDFDVDTNLNVNSVTVLSAPSHGSMVVGANGVITYTPFAFYNGVDSFVYQVCDFTSSVPMCDTAIVFLTIVPVPNAPEAANDTLLGSEDSNLLLSVLVNDIDQDSDIDSNSVAVLVAPINGTYSLLPNGVINYIPNPDFFGTDSLTYTVCDFTLNGVLCDTAKVYITIDPVDDAPVANNDTIITLEDVAVTFSLIANDTDVENNIDATSIVLLSSTLNGVTIVLSTGEITYTPNAYFNGLDSLVYSVCDLTNPTPLCDTAVVYFVIQQVGNTPTDILLDTLVIQEDNDLYTLIDHFETVDNDLPDDYFYYELVSGPGDEDNAQFSIQYDGLFIETKTNFDIKKEYKIRVRTTDSFGLFYEKSFVIIVEDIEGNDLPLPATDYISNNGDGKNDFFRIENVVIYDYFNLRIFDQFGQIVFEKENNYNNEFDGTRGGEKLPTGSYYYIFSSDSKKYQGNLTIMN